MSRKKKGIVLWIGTLQPKVVLKLSCWTATTGLARALYMHIIKSFLSFSWQKKMQKKQSSKCFSMFGAPLWHSAASKPHPHAPTCKMQNSTVDPVNTRQTHLRSKHAKITQRKEDQAWVPEWKHPGTKASNVSIPFCEMLWNAAKLSLAANPRSRRPQPRISRTLSDLHTLANPKFDKATNGTGSQHLSQASADSAVPCVVQRFAKVTTEALRPSIIVSVQAPTSLATNKSLTVAGCVEVYGWPGIKYMLGSARLGCASSWQTLNPPSQNSVKVIHTSLRQRLLTSNTCLNGAVSETLHTLQKQSQESSDLLVASRERHRVSKRPTFQRLHAEADAAILRGLVA